MKEENGGTGSEKKGHQKQKVRKKGKDRKEELGELKNEDKLTLSL